MSEPKKAKASEEAKEKTPKTKAAKADKSASEKTEKEPAKKTAKAKTTKEETAKETSKKTETKEKASKKAEKPAEDGFPTYKGKPLVRSGDTIYYGSMKDKYVIKIDIKTKKKVGDLDVADKVTVQLMYTDPEIRTRKQIVKTSEKNGLYLALDIAEAWLTRALAE